MEETARFTIGANVLCGDEKCGHLERVVVDPVARTLTHLVVDAGADNKRLVPIRLVDNSLRGSGDDGEETRLRCTMAEFTALESAQETEFLPGTDDGLGYDELGYGAGNTLAWPYYPLAMGNSGIGGPVLGAVDNGPHTVTYDRIPAGEVDLRRGARIEATDGEIGRVQGLVVDPEDHAVTHVLLQEGHLWGRKVVAIPIRVVTRVSGELRVQLSKAEIGDLPPVDLASGR